MAIQQSKRQSDLEKRLQILRQQVYGKSPDKIGSDQIKSDRSDKIRNSDPLIYRPTDIPIHRFTDTPTNRSADITYLHHDLLKILLFSSLAIGTQIILFFLLQNHFLKINF